MTRARVCAVQLEMKPVASFEAFADQCRYFADVAAGYRADFLLFPEMFTNQLLSLHPGADFQEALRLLESYTARLTAFFHEIATTRRVNLIAGSHFQASGNGKTVNAAHVVTKDGRSGIQLKIHVTPGERQAWGIAPGDAVEVFDTDKGKIAVQICYDVEFPEMTRRAAALGAKIVFVPFCTDDRQGYLRVRRCAEARCVENQIYVATAGIAGNLRGVREMDVHYAQSAIFTPSDFGFARDGVAAEAPANTEAVVVADLDLEHLEHMRAKGTVLNWQDRRPDLYRTWLS